MAENKSVMPYYNLFSRLRLPTQTNCKVLRDNLLFLELMKHIFIYSKRRTEITMTTTHVQK